MSLTQKWIRVYAAGAYGVGAYGQGAYGGEEVFDLAQTARSDRGRKNQQWETCTRCGFTYPISEMRLQTGDGGAALVCQKLCFDEPSLNDLRPEELPKEKPLVFVGEDGPVNDG